MRASATPGASGWRPTTRAGWTWRPWPGPRGAREPTIVCAQLGEVNTGGLDPIAGSPTRSHAPECLAPRRRRVRPVGRRQPAPAPPRRRARRGRLVGDRCPQVVQRAVRLGLRFVRDGAAHRAAMGATAAYLPPAPGQQREPFEYVPEMSRRGRGFVVYAALRQLGAAGVAEMVER